MLTRENRLSGLFAEALKVVQGELTTLDTAEAAARRIHDEVFHAIFVDIALPGLSHQGFARSVRTSRFNSQTSLVLLTGHTGTAATAWVGKDGVARMVTPARPAELDAFLRDLRRKLRAERRRGRRLPFRTSVSCIEGVRHLRAAAVDLSATGMLLEMSSPPSRGTEMELHFSLDPGEPVLKCPTRVVRLEKSGRVGVDFQNLIPSDRQRLQQFIARHLPSI